MNPDGENAEPIEGLSDLNADEKYPSYSITGQKIVFQKQVSDIFQIFIANSDGTNVQQITDNTKDSIIPHLTNGRIAPTPPIEDNHIVFNKVIDSAASVEAIYSIPSVIIPGVTEDSLLLEAVQESYNMGVGRVIIPQDNPNYKTATAIVELNAPGELYKVEKVVVRPNWAEGAQAKILVSYIDNGGAINNYGTITATTQNQPYEIVRGADNVRQIRLMWLEGTYNGEGGIAELEVYGYKK
jgi:hypothetical protein